MDETPKMIISTAKTIRNRMIRFPLNESNHRILFISRSELDSKRNKSLRVSEGPVVKNLVTSGNGMPGSRGRERGRFGRNKNVTSPGTRTRENYDRADGKLNSGEGRVGKSGIGTPGDSENIIRYQLSNELFIKLGWTLLPKDTIMRRVVEFQALVAKPHMNWFKNNRIHGKQYYTDHKTIFMNFLEDGSGHVYYPNGRIAIKAQTLKKRTHELYKVYGQGGRDIMGVVRQPSLMGLFDSMGNGVIYDEDCNIRLTYNQHGGVYVDNPAKVPFSWGWNNFQTFPIDEAVYEVGLGIPRCFQIGQKPYSDLTSQLIITTCE